MKKKVNMKEKVKAFWKEHGVEIEAGLTVIAVGAMGVTCGWVLGRRMLRYDYKDHVWVPESLRTVLRDAGKTYNGKVCATLTHMNGGFVTLDKLGEFGKQALDNMSPCKVDYEGFTHIIAIGPEIKSI